MAPEQVERLVLVLQPFEIAYADLVARQVVPVEALVAWWTVVRTSGPPALPHSLPRPWFYSSSPLIQGLSGRSVAHGVGPEPLTSIPFEGGEDP